MNIRITVQTRTDYNNVFNAIIGDSKHTMRCDSYKWTFVGTMTQSDYMSFWTVITAKLPHGTIMINADGQGIVISYDYDDDDNEWITINGIRQ